MDYQVGKIEFGPEQHKSFMMALNSTNIMLVLWDLDQEMRSNIKYDEKQKDTEHWRNRLYELMEEYNITFDWME